MNKLNRLGVDETMAIVSQISVGLDYAHDMDVIHRDIKPSNLMLSDTGVVKIMDFGIARIRGTQRLTQSGLLGTYAYLAPEQFRRGEGSRQSDMYSLACVVYEMLTGRIPFDAPTEAEMMRGHLDVPPPQLRASIPNIDPRIDTAIQRALAKDPAQRFSTIGEFADALGATRFDRASVGIIRQRILPRLPQTVPLEMPNPSGSPGPILKPNIITPAGISRKRPWFIPASAVASAGAVAFFVLVLLPPEPPPSSNQSLQGSPLPETTGDSHTALSGPKRDTNGFINLSDKTITVTTPDFINTRAGIRPLGSMSVTEVLNTKDPTADKIAEAKARVMSGNESKFIAGIEILKRLADDERSGHAAAELGRIYDPYQGYNLPGLISDVVTAARWYSNAAKYNDQSAAAERENLRRKLEEQARSDRRDEAAKRALGYWR